MLGLPGEKASGTFQPCWDLLLGVGQFELKLDTLNGDMLNGRASMSKVLNRGLRVKTAREGD